jgi:hypothetical protein
MVSYTVTLYKLFLGDQQDPTGHFQLGFTIHTITSRIFPKGTSINLGNGYYTRYSLTAFTKYVVDEGDVIMDTFGKYYDVLSVKTWSNGDVAVYNELEVEERPNFPFLAGFFGFEDMDHGTPGGMFEDGFERGYFAL